MVDTTYASNIVTDPHTLLGVSRAIFEQISSRANLLGPYAQQLIEQLRLLFIDTHQGLFVFGAPDEASRLRANLHARVALEKSLEAVFEEKSPG